MQILFWGKALTLHFSGSVFCLFIFVRFSFLLVPVVVLTIAAGKYGKYGTLSMLTTNSSVSAHQTGYSGSKVKNFAHIKRKYPLALFDDIWYCLFFLCCVHH
jgi:hypothetical protein